VRAVGLIITNFIMAMLVGALSVYLIDKLITSKGFKLTNISKYIIFSIIVIVTGILSGQMIVYLN
jgi:hypothetical protein